MKVWSLGLGVHMVVHMEAQGHLVNVMGIIGVTIELIGVVNCTLNPKP